jgi:hypothetical protein
MGDLDLAEQELRAALGLLEMTPLLRTVVLAAMAELYEARGRPAEALAAAEEALGREEPCRCYPTSEYGARLAQVKALLALGDIESARAALSAARDRLLSQASRIRDPRLRASFLAKPPWNDRLLALASELLAEAV